MATAAILYLTYWVPPQRPSRITIQLSGRAASKRSAVVARAAPTESQGETLSHSDLIFPLVT